MATKNEERIIEGIDTAVNPAVAEEDFVKGLLEAANYKEDDSNHKEIEIIRGGKKLFSFTIRPVSSDEFHAAHKKGSKFVTNPVNKRLPLVESEKDYSVTKFHSWLIYTATIDKDREKVWNNQAIKSKYGIMQPAESVPVLLKMGEMTKIVNIIMDMSDIDQGDDAENSVEEVVKN